MPSTATSRCEILFAVERRRSFPAIVGAKTAAPARRHGRSPPRPQVRKPRFFTVPSAWRGPFVFCLFCLVVRTGGVVAAPRAGGDASAGEMPRRDLPGRMLDGANAPAAEGKPEQAAKEWEDDDDDDDDGAVQSPSVNSATAGSNTNTNNGTAVVTALEINPGDGQKEVEGLGEDQSTPGWSDDDDDDDGNISGVGEKSTNKSIDGETSGGNDSTIAGGKSTSEWPEDDDDDDSVTTVQALSSANNSDSVNQNGGIAADGSAVEEGEGAAPDDELSENMPRSEFGDDDQVNADLGDKEDGGGASAPTAGGSIVGAASTMGGVGQGEAALPQLQDNGENFDNVDAAGAEGEGNDLLLPEGDGSLSSSREMSRGKAVKEPPAMEGIEADTTIEGQEAGVAETVEGGENNEVGMESGAVPDPNMIDGDGTAVAGGVEVDPTVVIAPENETPGWNNNNMVLPEEAEEDSFLEMVRSTFTVLALAAFFTSILVFRKRVNDRIRADANLQVGGAVREELVDVTMRLASWAASRAMGSSSDGNEEMASSSTGNVRGSSYGPETIPLSTATDEEWGWEDDDVGGGAVDDVELAGMGRQEEEEKENDDLALAIAMSLSENEKNGGGGEEESKGGKAVAPSVAPSIAMSPTLKSSFVSTATAKTNNKPKPPPKRSLSNSSSTPSRNVQQSSAAAPKPASGGETPLSSTAGGNSIEDLLGQMGGAGGPVITSFGQKPKKPPSKPKPAPKKESNDDIFATMGLSSFPSKAAVSGGTPSSRPKAPSSSGWQSTASMARPPAESKSAAVSAPLPTLLADTLDDMDGDSWGDDDDLDDLLDD